MTEHYKQHNEINKPKLGGEPPGRGWWFIMASGRIDMGIKSQFQITENGIKFKRLIGS